jgi:poly-gamma-glutamate synthesis protein (capsule biosynthesis protein)
MSNEAITLLLVGDTNVQNRAEPAQAFVHVMPMLREADVLFGQLEGPLSPPSDDPLNPDIPHKERWRHSDPAMVQGFTAAGFAAVSCASNVTYGARAILTSLATLDAAGIGHCGAGRTIAEARKPAIVERRGVRFGFLSYTSVFWPIGHAAGPETPGVATIKATTAYQPHPRTLEMPGAPPTVITTPDPHELAAMERDVRALRSEVDVLVISCHWGVSNSTEVVDYQRAIGRAAISAGADIVFGHHPHLIQEIEVWQGRPIFYSLGNFAFDWEKMRGRALDGILVRCTVRNRTLERVAFVPVRRDAQNLVAPLNPTEDDGQAMIEHVLTLSQKNSTHFAVENGEVVVEGISH